MSQVRTYQADNQFRFICPIFSADVAMRECFMLRDAWARGKRPTVRQGCQACLSASKCPIVHIINLINRDGSDIYYSATPKNGHLGPEILARIGPIVVPESTLNAYPEISERQKEMIRAMNGLNGVAALRSKREAAALEEVKAPPARIYRAKTDPKPEPAAEVDALAKAAASGDISAAINQAVRAA